MCVRLLTSTYVRGCTALPLCCVNNAVDGRIARRSTLEKEVVIFISDLVIFFASISYLITRGHTR